MSSQQRFDFEWLLSPCSLNDFVQEAWQQRPKLIGANDGRGVDRLFSSIELEELIEVGQPKPPSIRLAAQGLEKIGVPETGTGRLDLDKIRERFLDGYTLIVNNVQRFHARLNSLVQQLQLTSSFPVEANCYFTPPGSQGVHPHYDTHDVFVLQVEGEKEWHLFEESAVCPLNELVDGDPFRNGGLSKPESLILRPGNVLYIPRGWVHEALTPAHSSSLHITFGVHVATSRDLICAAIDTMSRIVPDFRMALPFGYLGRDGNLFELQTPLNRLLELLTLSSPIADAHALLEDDLMRRFSSTGATGLAQLSNALRRLAPSTKVSRARYFQVRKSVANEGISVEFLSRLVTVPSNYESALDFILQCDQEFTIEAIPGLDESRKIALVDRLLRDGLLRLEPFDSARNHDAEATDD